MDTFFHYLKKALVGCIALVFACIVTYTPQDYTERAEAGPATGGAFEVTQILNLGQLVKTGASAIKSAIAEGKLVLKEYGLDGIAWIALKQALLFMADAMVSWINSGFRDRPAFVQDMKDFLRREADAVIGNYIDDLTDGFLCDPFVPDIQFALARSNFELRNTPSNCTLTEIIDNAGDFVSGDPGSFSSGGGWETWFEAVGSPDSNTFLGSLLAAENQATELRLSKEAEETTKLGWGNGFLSITTCNENEADTPLKEQIKDSGGDCKVLTPGNLINDSLNSHLDSNRESLVAADEMNEAVGSFLSIIAGASFGNFAKNALGGGGTGGAAAAEATGVSEIEGDAAQIEADAEAAQAAASAASAEREAEERANVRSTVDEVIGELNDIEGAVNAIDPVNVNVNVQVDDDN